MDSAVVEPVAGQERRRAWTVLILVFLGTPFLSLLYERLSSEPRDRFLQVLQAEPVLDLDPPGAKEVSRLESPTDRNARGRACQGASISIDYIGDRPVDEVRDYYEKRLPALGWTHPHVGGYESAHYEKTIASRTASFRISGNSGAPNEFSIGLSIRAQESDCSHIPLDPES